MSELRAERFDVAADGDVVQNLLELKGWTDGLPVVPPTEERVAAMVASVDQPATTAIGEIPLAAGEATLEQLAANAVMAGCKPEYFPIVVAAVRAMLEPGFNLLGIQATTHPVAPLLVVSGPVARAVGVHGGVGLFGPGFRANATIGRAVRLVLMNLGLGHPGDGDRATHGSPAKSSICISENVAESPWPEIHTTFGYATDDDVVTVIGAEAPHNVNDHENVTATGILDLVVDTMKPLGHNNWYMSYRGRSEFVVVLGPEHARQIAAEGLLRADVQQYLFERARRPIRDLRRGGMWEMRDWQESRRALEADEKALAPLVAEAADILVLVAGGPGKHSLVIPTFAITSAQTMAV